METSDIIAHLKVKKWLVPPGLEHIITLFLAHLETAAGKPVMIVGNTGVGKSMFLEISKYYYSLKKFDDEETIIEANCAHFGRDGSDANIARAEIFGCGKDIAKSLKMPEKKGLLNLANNGLLILEEIGELAKDVQAMLLTFIETNEFRTLGGTNIEKSNIQIVSATNNTDLLREDFKNRFLRFNIPPIHARRGDILYYFLNKFHNILNELCMWEILILMSYNWPGNVREIDYVGFLLEREFLLTKNKNYTKKISQNYGAFKNSLLFGVFGQDLCDTGIHIERLINFELNLYSYGDESTLELYNKLPLFELTKRYIITNFKPKKFGDQNKYPSNNGTKSVNNKTRIEKLNNEFSLFCDFFSVENQSKEDILEIICNRQKSGKDTIGRFIRNTIKIKKEKTGDKISGTDHPLVIRSNYIGIIEDLNKKTLINDSLSMKKNIWFLSENELLSAYYKGVLLLSGLNIKVAAERIGTNERTLRNRINSLGIKIDSLKKILNMYPELEKDENEDDLLPIKMEN